ncbi:MAG: serine/threonine-protein kinase [Myxococcota bacterium]
MNIDELQSGALIEGRYRVERLIAQGGQAAVYLARQEPLDRRVALKILHATPDAPEAEKRTFQQRFLREAKTLATLDHPNIVVIYDYGQIGIGSFYIAMEYVQGVRFNDLHRGKPLEPTRALTLISQVCSALSYAHNRGVIHRDIKHSNLMVRRGHDGKEQVKVLDFGIAKMMMDNSDLTLTGTIMGSPHFMAPEQARGMKLDPRVDIYAVGVLLYCSLTGRYPFEGTSFREILFAHLGDDVPPFQERNPDISLDPNLEATVRRCLAKEPDERFPNIDTLQGTLTSFINGQPLISTQTLQRRGIPSSKQKPRAAWLLPVLIAGGAFLITSGLLVAAAAVAYVVMF